MRSTKTVVIGTLLALDLCFGAKAYAATIPFQSTSSPEAWKMTINISNIDNNINSFLTTGFFDSTIISGRFAEEVSWIANNSTGTNAPGFAWTQFVFRQQFDLTGYDPLTATLSFQWAADDSGEGFASRGAWIPKYRLNGGNLINGAWPTSNTYSLGLVTNLTTGFIEGVNTIDFYVQGNGVTDGFALRSLGLNADVKTPPPVPGPLPVFGAIGGFIYTRKLRRRIQRSR
jgi:hypothetical protein